MLVELILVFKDEMAGMIGDDIGDNISVKNPQYCEMTAHYWIWKNVHEAEYVGVRNMSSLRLIRMAAELWPIWRNC